MQLQFFPSKPTALYMGKMFIIRTIAVLAMLVVVLQALDLLGESGKILAVDGNSESDLWVYIGLRAPEIIARFLPFSVLLGTIITLATLNQNSEIVAMKAAGLSAHQILAPLILASSIIALISFLFNDNIVAPGSAKLKIWQDAEYSIIPPDDGIQSNVWVKEGNDIIAVESVSGIGDKAKLNGVTLYIRQESGLRTIIKSKEAAYNGDGWLLRNADSFNVLTASSEGVSDLIIGRGITPSRFRLSKVDGNGLSFSQLDDAIRDLKLSGRRTSDLEAILWHKISGPLSAILMPLLGAVAAFGLARSGALFFRAVLGMALGFAYFVADNFALAMGNLGAYPPLIAAWAPLFLFFLIGETVLVKTEE